MSLVEAAILGIVQGLTEFLPVSSSGHLVLAGALLDVELPGVVFEVVVHVGTLVAVLWAYRTRILALGRGLLGGERRSFEYVSLLALASVPAGLVGFFGRDMVEAVFARPVIAAAMLIVTGGMVWTVRYTRPEARQRRPEAGQAIWVGCAQALALLPGISRSGATVATGMWRGVEGVRMAEFSFLMSVPAIGGAALLQVGEVGSATADLGLVSLGTGFLTALVAGVVAIRVFVRTLRRGSFQAFAFYCWAAGGGYLVAALLVPGLR